MQFSGPMFEKSESKWDRSIHKKDSAHYNTYECKENMGMEYIHQMFENGKCDEFNLIVFSTSGVHGSYVTIEEIESSLLKYGDKVFGDEEEPPEDYTYPYLTFLIIQPRLVCLRYGNTKVKLEDIPFLKNLRESSREAFVKIG